MLLEFVIDPCCFLKLELIQTTLIVELSVQEFDKTVHFLPYKTCPKSSAMFSLSLVLLACVYFPACGGDFFSILRLTAKRKGT